MNYALHDFAADTSKRNGAVICGMCSVSFLEYRYYVSLFPVKGKFSLLERSIKYEC